MMDRFASTPEPPYYAVIFASQRNDEDARGYDQMSDKMTDLALAQPGCLGAEATRDEQGFGITVSYWKDEQSIKQWKAHLQHATAQRLGKERWSFGWPESNGLTTVRKAANSIQGS